MADIINSLTDMAVQGIVIAIGAGAVFGSIIAFFRSSL